MTKTARADWKSLHNVTALNDFVLQARSFCTEYSLPVSSCPLRGLFFNYALKKLFENVVTPNNSLLSLYKVKPVAKTVAYLRIQM